jgi:hypothetical protein
MDSALAARNAIKAMSHAWVDGIAHESTRSSNQIRGSERSRRTAAWGGWSIHPSKLKAQLLMEHIEQARIGDNSTSTRQNNADVQNPLHLIPDRTVPLDLVVVSKDVTYGLKWAGANLCVFAARRRRHGTAPSRACDVLSLIPHVDLNKRECNCAWMSARDESSHSQRLHDLMPTLS